METTTTPSPAVVTTEQRRATLQQAIDWHTQIGYRVLSQTDTTAQLTRPKSFSCLLATLLLLCFFPLALIYLFFYLAAQDSTAYIAVNEAGHVTVNGRVLSPARSVAPARPLFTEISETLRGSTMGQRVMVAWDEGGTAERAAIVGGGVAIGFTMLLCMALPVLALMQ